MSVVLIPEKQKTDFSVSFWDYLHSRSTLGIPIPFEMCVHMLKCQKMPLQSTEELDATAEGKRLNNTNIALLLFRPQYLRGTVYLPDS